MKFSIEHGPKGYWVRTLAANGRVLGNSTMYPDTPAGKKKAFDLADYIADNAGSATLVDNTGE